RPDTLFGGTYVAVAAEHPLAKAAAENNPELAAFLEEGRHIKVAEADMATLEKQRVHTGVKAVHPLTREAVRLWAAHFVLMEYGSGAVMAVPAHDQRDWEFARAYDHPLNRVINCPDGSESDVSEGAYVEKGVLVVSGEFTGLSSEQAFEAI